MFKVECVGCQAPYQVDERRVPDKGLKMRCPKCGTTFKVEPPAAGVEPSPTATGEAEELLTAGAASQPFSSGGAELGAKLNKPPSARDSLARTMIGVSSGDLAAANKDAAADPNKPKAFRIPRPTLPTPEPARVRAPVTEPLLAEEVGLPATPAQARAGLGLTSRGAAEPDAALPRLASEPRRHAVAEPAPAPAAVDARAPANDAPPPEEVQHVLPSVAPVGEVSWLAGEEVVDTPSLRPAGAARAPTAQARPLAAAPPTTAKAMAATPDDASLGLEPLDNLPAVPPVKRPPPRRPRPAADAAPEPRAELPARPEVNDPQDTGLPAVVATPARQAGKAPPQPAHQKAGVAGGELDLPAFAPRPDPRAAQRAPAAPLQPSGAALVDLPSLPARPAP
ncbi:MAG TPA: zinc-ribbon domain-containing protein, partial [Polyangiaceae bacterium]|nr:zinc-ribbon domain-containing protein [Polyangiaceae bacterium]